MKLALPTVNISTRFAAVASTLVVISALTIGVILFSANSQILISNAEAELAFDMNQAGTDLQESANSAAMKVAFLAELPQVRELVDTAGTPERARELKQQLTRIFVSLASTSEHVMQVRMIGAADSGRELVRVDRKGSAVSEIDLAELQQKGDRPYVKNHACRGAGHHFVVRHRTQPRAGAHSGSARFGDEGIDADLYLDWPYFRSSGHQHQHERGHEPDA